MDWKYKLDCRFSEGRACSPSKPKIGIFNMILLIDNYDSFTYNLVQMMASQGADIKVFRNDDITLEQAIEMKPAGLIISPGPCNPDRAGVSVEFIKYFGKYGNDSFSSTIICRLHYTL